jgi:hypothetical protein
MNNKEITTVVKEQEMSVREIMKGGSAYEAIMKQYWEML